MANYKTGEITKANVTSIKPYGVFVSLDDNYSGLIHISEIADGYIKDINDFVKIGEELDAKIIDVDENTRHVRLSTKDTIGKSARMKIQETKLGFKPLGDNLDKWISEKISEIDK